MAEKVGLTREAVASYEILGIKHHTPETQAVSRRWARRMMIIEGLPESIKKHILRTLDDIIKANTRLSIFDD
jgi:hypothetical protein